MRFRAILAGAAVLGGTAICPAADLEAQPAAEAEAAVRAHYAAINAGDVETATAHHAPRYTLFFLDGGERTRYASSEAQLEEFSAMFEDGFATDWRIGDLEVDLHGGDDVAVATFYVTGSVTMPGGTTEEGTWRVTEIWAEADDGWHEVHAHMSPMDGSPDPRPGTTP